MSGESKQGLEMQKQLAIVKVPGKISVKHMKNTSNLQPNDSTSWKQFWEKRMSSTFPTQKEKCPCCHKGRNPDDFVGSHIYEVADKNKMYIYPICKSCNSEHGEGKTESPIFNVLNARCVTFHFSDCKEVPEHHEEFYWERPRDV